MPLNIDWQQILLHLLNFVILAGGLYFLLYKPVKKFMLARKKQYEEREAESQRLLAEAEALKARTEEKYRQADEEIQHRREQASEELEAEKRQQLTEARAQARQILSTASKTAEMRTQKAVEESREEIRSLAVGMVERLVLESGGDALDQFLNEAESEQGNG